MTNLFLDVRDGDIIRLPADDGMPEAVHIIDEDSILAVNAALATGRPLLVRGEPGTGKSQLARAAAKRLGRADRKSTRLNSSHGMSSRMPSSA